MASSSTTTPLLSSPPSSINNLQQYWLKNSTQTYINHLQVNTHLPICIFHLPQTITSQNQDSFIPDHIGLGPIHHFHTDLYSKQEQLKLTTTKAVLKSYETTNESLRIINKKVIDIVPEVRCCYDLYFDTDDECLAWLFVVDGLFLLDIMLQVANGRLLECLNDVIMVENQIPLVILVQLLSALHQHSSFEFDKAVDEGVTDGRLLRAQTYSHSTSENGRSDQEYKDSYLSNLLVKFCESQSPLKFTTPESETDFDICNSYHLLDCMYQLIVNHNLPPPKNPFLRTNLLLDVHMDDVENVVQMAGGLFPGANAFLQPVLLVLKLPWDKIITLIKKTFGDNPTMHEIDIPSVSKLSRIGKIEFCTNPTNPGGIHDVKFDEQRPSITLPVLDMKPGSEVLLRNLVAYEELMFKKDNITNLYITEYVDLMCGIIDGVKDVKILREKDIIVGDMSDADIVKLFNGITKSGLKTERKTSELQKTIVKVNTYYGDIPRVKVFRFFKRVFLASWKILAIVISVLSLVLMVFTGVCKVYDCKGRFGLGNVRLVLDYVSQDNQVVDF